MSSSNDEVHAIVENAATARDANLVYVSDTDPGIRRRRKGAGFYYLDVAGKRITDREVVERIRKLAIPPAYASVWICPTPRGHLQATGRDARGRKQYRYHVRWRGVRDQGKFNRLIDFAQRLPRLRRRLAKDLKLSGLPKEKVLAIVVSVLAATLVRIGNAKYREENGSFGLTTLLARHVEFLRGRAVFRFRGKSGIKHAVPVNNTRLVRLLRRCQQLPGQALFQYLDEDNKPQTIDSSMVNEYLCEAMGAAFTAKDFRTWGGTLQAIAVLASTALPEPFNERNLAMTLNACIKAVAKRLRNTPAVCRNSYIHPTVIQAWKDGSLRRIVKPDEVAFPRKLEQLALRFLRGHRAH